MFSIIIPLYNKANYIEKAILSVLSQSFEKFELIIVNDGSTDNGNKIVQHISDSRLLLIEQQNSGVSNARNTGVQVAKFDYIAFLDADDWWSPFFLEQMLSLINNFPDAGIYGCKYFWVKNGLPKISVNHESPNFEGYINYFKAYLYAWWMPLSSISVVIPKSIFDEMNGFKKELKFGEDLDLWLRIALKYKVAYTNQPLAYYNQDVDESNRAIVGKKHWQISEHVIFNLDYFKYYESKDEELKSLLDGLRVRSLVSFYLQNNYLDIIKSILTSVDFSKQPLLYRFIYKAPKAIVIAYFQTKKLGSSIKRFIIKKTHFFAL